MNVGRFVSLVLLLLVCPAPAWGNEICFVPLLAVKEGYNSNVMLVTEADNVTEDYITTLSAGFEITDRNERLDSLLSLRLDRLEYARNDELSATNQQYSGSIQYTATPLLRISAEAGYQKNSNPSLDTGPDIPELPPGTVITIPDPPTTPGDTGTGGGVTSTEPALPLVAVPVERITSAVSADYHLTENTMLTAGYRYRWSSYEEPQYRDTSHDIQAGLAADLGKHLPRVKGRLNTSYSRYLLPDSRTINVKGTIGFSYDVSETWSIFVDGGLRRTDSELFLDEWVPFGPDAEIKVREQRDNTAWGRVGQLSLNYKGEYTAAELLYIKDLTLASGLQAATDSDGLSLSARYRITYELSAFLTTSYSMFRSDPAQGADHVIRQNNISISPSVRYDLSRNLALEASYERTRINYLASNTEANRHAYFIRLSARFPRCSSSQYK